jgi:hypothetical protein
MFNVAQITTVDGKVAVIRKLSASGVLPLSQEARESMSLPARACHFGSKRRASFIKFGTVREWKTEKAAERIAARYADRDTTHGTVTYLVVPSSWSKKEIQELS